MPVTVSYPVPVIQRLCPLIKDLLLHSFLSSESKIKSNTEEVLTSCCAGVKISYIFRWGVNLDKKQCSSMVSGTGIYEDKLTSWLAGQARWGEQRKSSLCFFAA